MNRRIDRARSERVTRTGPSGRPVGRMSHRVMRICHRATLQTSLRDRTLESYRRSRSLQVGHIYRPIGCNACLRPPPGIRMSSQNSSPVVAHRGWIFLLAALLVSTPCDPAKAQTSLAQVADTSPFRPLDLPAPNDVRTGSGRPGAKYWQQRVDYKITATLDPARNELRGRETINYVNRSPDALPYLWLFVEQNLCAPNSITNQLNQLPLVFLGSSFDFSCQGFNGGGHLESLRIAGVEAKRTVYGTTMRVDLPSPLASSAAVDLAVSYT